MHPEYKLLVMHSSIGQLARNTTAWEAYNTGVTLHLNKNPINNRGFWTPPNTNLKRPRAKDELLKGH